MTIILLYMDYKTEKFCIKENDDIMDIYVKYNLDSSYIHNKSNQNDTSVYFICKKKHLHTIYYKNDKIEIPIYMNVLEFQIYVNLFEDIYSEKNEKEFLQSKQLYFLDDTFTSNWHYNHC